jgi:hypothetical protein
MGEPYSPYVVVSCESANPLSDTYYVPELTQVASRDAASIEDSPTVLLI